MMAVGVYGLVGLVRNRLDSFSPMLCTLVLLLAGVGMLMQRLLKHYRSMLIRDSIQAVQLAVIV